MLTLKRCWVRIFSTRRISGILNLTPTCGMTSRLMKFFFSLTCRQTAFIMRRLIV